MNKTQLNINNLTELWSLGGKAAGTCSENNDFIVSIVPDSEWPNKLWFRRTPNNKTIDLILEQQDIKKITIPVWGDNIHAIRTRKMLDNKGLTIKSVLTGMSIGLNRTFNSSNNLNLITVDDSKKAQLWSELFQKAFGYLIHSETVRKTMNDIDYFIASYAGKQIGTAALFIDNNSIAGIHSMGIIPQYRRKGFAEELLIHLLKIAQHKKIKQAVLQASSMGEHLYLKTGFKIDFQLTNFIKQ